MSFMELLKGKDSPSLPYCLCCPSPEGQESCAFSLQDKNLLGPGYHASVFMGHISLCLPFYFFPPTQPFLLLFPGVGPSVSPSPSASTALLLPLAHLSQRRFGLQSECLDCSFSPSPCILGGKLNLGTQWSLGNLSGAWLLLGL